MDRSPVGSSKGSIGGIREGENGGNLPNIAEERSEELQNSRSFRDVLGTEPGSASQEPRSRSPRQSSPLPDTSTYEYPSPVPPAGSTSGAATTNTMSTLGMGSAYSIPLTGGRSPLRARLQQRPQRPSLDDPGALKDDDDSNASDLEENSSSLMKSTSGSGLSSFLSSPGGRRRPLSRNSQFGSSAVPNSGSKSPKPSAALRRSVSLGNRSTSTGSAHGSNESSGDNASSSISNTPSNGTVISSLNLGTSTVGFTSNLSRKSQNFRHSIAKRSGGALARLTRHGSSLEDGPGEIGSDAQKKAAVYRYSIGDPVLISNHTSRLSNCVNRHGFPPGGGNSSDEQRGPYMYVLGTVKIIHYEENAVFYTVTRADTGIDVRGDPGRYCVVGKIDCDSLK
jgi:hypothetical protein